MASWTQKLVGHSGTYRIHDQLTERIILVGLSRVYKKLCIVRVHWVGNLVLPDLLFSPTHPKNKK